jgi:Tol biopolymer transport system component
LGALGLSALAALAGCGGGGSRSSAGTSTEGGGTQQTFGPMITRAVGTAQAPVSASSSNATVTGIAGAAFDLVTQVDTSPNSLDDTKIAFTSNRTGNNEIFTIKPDGTGLKNLTNNNASDDRPSWSPDGTKIAFNSNRSGNQEIFVMNADGTGAVNRTNNAAGDVDPAWSPDGTKIAFLTNRDGNSEIYTMNPDGTGVKRLTNNAASDTQPAWSPDGKLIAFVSDRDGNEEIYTMNAADGSNPTRLTNNTDSDSAPAWSPDGKLIAFTSDRAQVPGGQPGPTGIWTMNPDGSGVTLVSLPSLAGFSNNGSAAWSPDGSSLAFTSDRDGNTTIGLFVGVLLSGQLASQQVTFAGANPSWSGYLARTPKKLVGSGGIMASAAAGFVFAQAGGAKQPRSHVSSVVTFDTSAPASRVNARIDALSGGSLSNFGTSNVVLSITDGDATLSNLRYMNSADGKVIQAVGTTAVPTAAGILVSFDGSDGSVATVVPYNATKAAGNAMKPTREGNVLVFRGSFPGVWTGQGENVAPGGAHLVKLDAKTGQLIQAQ